MSKTNRKSKPEIVLPPITVMEDEARRLNALASSSAMLFPRVAHFLAQEMERASVKFRSARRGPHGLAGAVLR